MAAPRGLRSLFQAIALLGVVFLLIAGFGFFHNGADLSRIKPIVTGILKPSLEPEIKPSEVPVAAPATPQADPPANPPEEDKNSTLIDTPAYIHSILNPSDTSLPRLECPKPDLSRYFYLGGTSGSLQHGQLPRYFFALDLYQCVHLLPRLIGSIVETMYFLGPQNCVLSIVEGRSDDGTFEVLDQLRASMQLLGVKYHFQSSDINPLAKGENRIEGLAKLRNLAVEDLIAHPEHYDEDTTVIFSNDISLCMEDILEIIHQRKFQGADQTCAMDWAYVGDNPTFYDVWIARGMTGDLFFNIPEDGNWDSAWNLFWNDPKAHARWSSSKPFQVFSCWNGITAFNAKPLMEKKIKFRSRKEGECFQGEPKLFAKDMWFNGYGKILVVPSVNVGYSDDAARKIKALKGYTSKHVANEGDDIKIEWQDSPPEQVKCMPG
jgi:alpha-1,3-mannosyltransferase